jgi:hypothetical protein
MSVPRLPPRTVLKLRVDAEGRLKVAGNDAGVPKAVRMSLAFNKAALTEIVAAYGPVLVEIRPSRRGERRHP